MATGATSNFGEIDRKLDEEIEGVKKEEDKLDVAAPEKDMVSDSHSGSDSVSKHAEKSEKEASKTQEPEPLYECSGRSEAEANHPATQVDAGKEAENPESGAIREDKPGRQEQEVKATEIETGEPVQTVDVLDTPSQPADPEVDSSPEMETTKETAEHSAQVPQVKDEALPSEPEKESTETLEQWKVLHTEKSSGCGGPSDELGDASESHPPQQQVLAAELEEEERSQPVAIRLEDKSGEHETVSEEVGSKEQDAENGAAPEAVKQLEETEPCKVEEDGDATVSVEIVSATEPEAHASVIESSPSNEAEKVKEADTKKEYLNEPNAAEQVENEASNKEETKEPSAVEVLSIKIAEQELSAQEAHQADTPDDGNDSCLQIAAEKVDTDVGNKEEALSVEVGEQTAMEAVKAKEAIEERNVKKEDEVPVAGNGDVQVVSESQQVAEAVKNDKRPETKTEAVEEVTRESDTAISQASEDSGEAPVKQKQSNNIFSKVKQSLVKVKKAITGKSPNLKTVTSDVNAQ